MKIIVVHVGDILKYPPVIGLINVLDKIGTETVVITSKGDFTKRKFKNVRFKVLGFDYENLGSPLKKMLNIFRTRSIIDKIIREEYTDDAFIWITYNVSLKHMNVARLKKYRYVLQLMELSEKIKLYEKLPFEFDAPAIANNAVAVVVPEYNRAHITKAWWQLDKLPLILPNKAYYGANIAKNSVVEDAKAREVLDKIKDKKIILYQGILTIERPLEVFIKAVDKLGDEYAFVVMSGGKNIYENIDSKNYYFIPFVDPPYHLQITSHAYIGVLTYIPVKSEFSQLNVLYCAPNKIYEYSKFGIPMLGNDLPGLKFLFETNHCGVCFDEFTEDSICDAILEINKNYDVISQKSYEFYDKADYEKQLKEILNKVKERSNL